MYQFFEIVNDYVNAVLLIESIVFKILINLFNQSETCIYFQIVVPENPRFFQWS